MHINLKALKLPPRKYILPKYYLSNIRMSQKEQLPQKWKAMKDNQAKTKTKTENHRTGGFTGYFNDL